MSKVDAARFVLHCRNWSEVALPIATHKPPPRIILRNGARFDAQAIYWADMYSIFFQGIYTPRYLPIERNDLVVDIGANIGVFSIYAASKTRNVVYSIEPSPTNFQAVQHNILINKLQNVCALNYAVSDHSGTELFFSAGASQHHRLKKVICEATDAYIEVPSITLQDLMDSQQIAQIDFLKLDCEGAEEAIFQSTPRRYLQRVCKVALEFHDHLTHINHDGLRKHLEEAGFTTRIYWDGKSVLGFIYAWRS